VLQKFIKRFPDSPLSINAQQRIEILKKAARNARIRPAPSGKPRRRLPRTPAFRPSRRRPK